MALVYRSVLDVDAPEVSSWVGSRFEQLVSQLAKVDVELGTDGELVEVSDRLRAAASVGHDRGYRAFRGRQVELRDGVEIHSIVTAIDQPEGHPVVWVDVNRLAEDAYGPQWVPPAPKIVNEAIGRFECTRSVNGFPSDIRPLKADQGALLAYQVVEEERVVPIVAVTPTPEEEQGQLDESFRRARLLQRHLAGVAPVYLLRDGAVESFSRALEVHGLRGLEVHSGAIRTYLPGAGRPGDFPGRHRVAPPQRFRRKRNPEVAIALHVARNVVGQATHQRPPAAWDAVRELPVFQEGTVTDSDWEAFQADVDRVGRENDELKARLDILELEKLELQEEQDHLQSERDNLNRRLRFAEARLREQEVEPEAIEEEPELPDWRTCTEVVEYIVAECPLVGLGEKVREGAEGLDAHDDSHSWARKAGRAVLMLQGYATYKQDGGGMGLLDYCERFAYPSIPKHWIAMKESETTERNARFRQLRTFRVDPSVHPSGEVFMEPHIKLVAGGYPAPRLHFHDDTAGETGRIHIGWLGPHLDNRSTS